MDTIFALLTFIALIMLIVSLIKPSIGLFFLKDGKTRKKAGLIYGGTFILSFILFSVFAPEVPQSSTSEISDETTSYETEELEIEDSYLENKSVKKWINKSKRESYIEDLIEGTWFCDYSIIGLESFEPKLETHNREISKQGESTLTLYFKDGFLPEFKRTFINFYTMNSPSEQVLDLGSYRVDDQVLTLKIQKDITDISSEPYEVLFISNNAFIAQDASSLSAYSRTDDSVQAEKDIQDFISYFRTESLKQIIEITKKYSSDILKSESELSGVVSNLQKFSLIRDNIYPINVKSRVDEFRIQYSNVSDSLFAEKYSSQLDRSEYYPSNDKYPVVEGYILKFEEIQNELLSLITSRKAANQKSVQLESVYKTEFEKYKKMYALYSVYGDGNEYAMKTAAIDGIKETMNNPKSFEFVEGWPTPKRTKSGWVYYIKFRGSNAFGGIITNDRNVVLRFDPEYKIYKAVDVY